MDENIAPAPAPVINGDTTMGEPAVESSWRSGLNEEYSSNPSLSEYKDINGLAKSHIELQKMMGSSVRIPAEDASPEDLNKFYSKLGRPEESSKYEYANAEIPEEIKNDEALATFKQKAFDLGLSSKQFQELAKYYDDMNVSLYNQNAENAKTVDAEFNTLMTETFGGKHEEAFNTAQNLFAKYLTPEESQSLGRLDNKALIGVVKTLNSIKSEFMTEDSVTNSNILPNSPSSKKDELIKLREELKNMDEFTLGYKEKCARKRELYEEVGTSVY